MRTILYICVLLIMILAISLSVSISNTEKLNAENARVTDNLNQYGRAISTLTLTNSELEIEIEKRNTIISEADSILRANKRRISQLESLVSTRIYIRDTDTVFLTLITEPVITKPADPLPLYKSNFSNTKSCITVSGFVLSTDSFPSVAITERSSDMKIYDIRIERKWWQFWRPKEERFIESTCGDVEVLTIYRKK